MFPGHPGESSHRCHCLSLLGLELASPWEVVETARPFLLSHHHGISLGGARPKGAFVPQLPSRPSSRGNREWPWACSPETALGLEYRLSLAFQVARGWRLLNSVPPSPLSLACTAWVEMLAWLLRVGLGSWGRGSRGSLRTEGGFGGGASGPLGKTEREAQLVQPHSDPLTPAAL